MSKTWVPALKPPHPSSIPAISELAQRIINALTLEAEEEEREMTRLYGPYRGKKCQMDCLVDRESVNDFNNESENNARRDCENENETKEDDINELFNYTGSFLSSLESLTPDLFTNSDGGKDKNNTAEGNLKDKTNEPKSFIFRERISKKTETVSAIPRRDLTVKKSQTTIDDYFKNIKKPSGLSTLETGKKSSNTESDIILESVNWETSDKGKTEGNHNEKFSNLNKAFIFARPETAIRKRPQDANEAHGTGKMQRSDNSINKIKKFIRPLKSSQKRQRTLEDYILN